MANMNGQKVTREEKIALTKKEALIHAEVFYKYKLIAKATGIDEDTLKNYRNDDKEFSDELEKARARFIGKRMRAAKPEFILERLAPEYFKEPDKRIEVTTPLPILGGATQNDNNQGQQGQNS